MLFRRARSKKVATVAAGLLLTTFAIGVASPVAFAPAATAATGTLSGIVYNDYDNNGVKNSGEPGVQGGVLYAYDVDGHQFGPATTNASGVYTFSLTTVTAGAMRVELQSMPAGFQPSAVGTDNATTIRFVDLSAGATVNNLHFAIQKPSEYCQNNPDIATTLFCVGNGNNGATTLDAIWHSTYDSQTRTGVATPLQVGSVDAVAWDPVTRSVFASAYIKRHSGLNDTYGADALYVMKPDTNVTTHWVDLSTLGIDVGQSAIPSNTARDLTGSTLQSADPVFAQVGKYGIGDMETNGADTLYVTNLFQRTVHAVPIPADGSAPTTSTSLGMPGSAISCTNGTARPFALAYQDGYIYSGVVCDAANGTTADLDAYVVRTTGDGTWTQVGPRIDLDYANKGAVYTGDESSTTSVLNRWHIWDDTFDSSWDVGTDSRFANTSVVVRPTPMLSDIDFDDDGSMVLAFRDRTGDMIGADNFAPLAVDGVAFGGTTYKNTISDIQPAGVSPVSLVYTMAGGDVLRMCATGGSYVLEGATGCASNVANGEGPGGGEYYGGDTNGNIHQEISYGHVAIAPRSGQLLLSAMGAANGDLDASGIHGLDNATGATVPSISASYYSYSRPAYTPHVAVFAKANGMGDIEALCDAAPLEIGNRIWTDTNGNGIQDPAETGIDGVTVRLYAASDTTFTTPLGTAVTSGGGQYYFRTGYTDSNLTDNVGGGLAYRTGYVIRIGTAANYTGAGPLMGKALSPANQAPSYTYAGDPDTIDSDPAAAGIKANMGSTWYPTISVSAASTLPGHNNHTYDAGFVPPMPHDLALRKTVVSMNGAPSTGTVTFQLEVFNQTADAVNGVTITDYIDPASFQPMTVSPVNGTTGGAAALAYAWDNTSTTNPAVSISGVIPGNSSVTLNVTLAIATPVNMAGLLNTAEISKFDNDGNPVTGDSTTGVVYDVDSIPDATNSDVVVDDEIALTRWTNSATTQAQNTSVLDEDDHDIARVPLFDLALIKTRSAGQSATIVTPSTTGSFDITVKNQGQAPVYNLTVLDSPVSPLTQSASTAASQSVTTTLGAPVTVTFNLATGVFTIPTLAAGDTVTFTVLTTLALVNTVQVNGAEITSFDNDNNAGNAKPSWVQDVDSTPDSIVGNDALEAGTDPAGFPEDSHNLIDNAPINGANPADEDDQDTEAVQLGLLRLGSTVYKDLNGNNNGDIGEGVAGVLVQLFQKSGLTYTQIASTVTNADGDYSFDRLYPGTYQVGIPSTQSGGGVVPAALTEWEPLVGSVAGPEALNFDNDGDAESGFISRSDDVVLTFNGEPADDAGDGTRANALTSPRAYTDANSNLNIDFVFNQVTYELGNLVWSDKGAGAHYNNGIADSDETGIDGVVVELYRDNGAGGATANDGILAVSELIATTTTSGGGFYTFKSLVAATDYHVVVVKSSVPVGMAVAGTPVTVAAADGVDNDNNAAVVVSQGWSSGKIALGPVATAEPTGEKDGTTGTTAQPAASVADNRADQTVDFGFVFSISLGNQVFFDANGNGVFEPVDGDFGIDGVTVILRDSSGAYVDSTTTAGGGLYLFADLVAGTGYYVEIPATEFATSGDLNGLFSSVGDSGSTDDSNVDGLDRGVDPASPYGAVRSAGVWVATASAAPSATDGISPNPDNDSIRPDSAENLVVDFGFYRMELGGTVFLDPTNDGLDGDTGDFAGVTVLLYRGDGSAYLRADGSQATTVTDANGNYVFSGLPAGQYIVEIPAKEFTEELDGYANSDGNDPVPSPDNDVTGEDNGYPVSGEIFSGGPVRSELITLAPASEPQDDQSPTSGYADNMSNLSVDFGFWHAQVGLELGNQVWFDSDRDGLLNHGESPVPAGVVLELLDADTGAVLDTTTTDSNGQYLFTGLVAGRYVVKLPPVNFILGGLLAGYMATDGAGVSGNPNDGTDSDSNALPLSVSGIKSATVTLRAAAPILEAELASEGLDDRQSNLTVDFGLFLGTPLAFTGADVDVPLRQAGLLVGLGMMLLFAARRRRED